MNITVAGEPVEPARIGFREMGFGQPAGRPMLPVSLSLDAAEALRMLRPVYDQFAAEARTEPDRSPVTLRLARLGFPAFADLQRRDSALLAQIIVRSMPLETLHALLPLPHRRLTHAINAIRSAEFAAGGVTLQAEAFAI